MAGVLRMNSWGEPVLFNVEQELYPLVKAFLNLEFYERVRPRLGSMSLIVEEISRVAGSKSGRWTRPDLAAVGITRPKYSTSIKIDLYSFEVKLPTTVDALAVHEALAHKSFVNYSFLVWNRSAITDKKLQEIEWSCKEHSVGLVVAHNPVNASHYEIRHFPERKELSSNLSDEFIEERFSSVGKKKILETIERMASVNLP